MPLIHPTAIVESGAELAEDVQIGPYGIIGPNVILGPGTVIDHHASVIGRTAMGSGNRVFPFAAIGGIPQDLKYRGEPTELVIGDHNIFRESVTAQIGTDGGGGVTRIGSNCLFMAYSHVAHDCVVSDHVIMANCSALGGHVAVAEHAIIGGLCGVHQFVRIGRFAIVGGCTGVFADIPPFVMAAGNRAELHGLNLVGLKRAGFSDERIAAIKKAYRIIFRSSLTLDEALAKTESELGDSADVAHLASFLRGSTRGFVR